VCVAGAGGRSALLKRCPFTQEREREPRKRCHPTAAICMGEDGAARATPVRRHRFTKGVIGRLLLLVHGPSHAGMK
jgi:hypothetical protein